MSDFAQSVDPVLIEHQDAAVAVPAVVASVPAAKPVTARISACLRELWQTSEAARYGIGEESFAATLTAIGERYHYGQNEAAGSVSDSVQIDFLRTLHIADLALARACAAGSEAAWEQLMRLYRETIHRAACAVTREESSGSELAGSVYAWLYGIKNGATKEQNGARISPLTSYAGRGSLSGWLRTVLAQRFVDEYRRTRREISLDEQEETRPFAAAEAAPVPNLGQLSLVAQATSTALRGLRPEDNFLLASYYLDRRTLQQIAQMLGVHESTVSRKLARLTHDLRKQLLKQLRSLGLDRRAAEEALGIDVRDVDIDIRKILQIPAAATFSRQERALPEQPTEDGIHHE